jgi:hypothetical protein
MFRIADDKRGRPRVYCTPQCKFRSYYARHKDAVLESQRRRRDPVKRSVISRRYYARHKDAINLARRRARESTI